MTAFAKNLAAGMTKKRRTYLYLILHRGRTN
jgi:hypothetical protein